MKHLSGGSGTRAIVIGMKFHDAVLNDTAEEYEIASAYDTVRSGRAERIAIQPGEIAVRNRKGSAYDFASWSVGQLEEFPQETKIVSLTDCLRYA